MAKGDFKLIVVDAFDDYRRGDEITDDKMIAKVLGDKELQEKVQKVAVAVTTIKEGK